MSRALTAAVHQEEDRYIARCLEVEVASQGRSIQEALANLAEAVRTKGSHEFYRHPDGRGFTIPRHRTIKRGTLASAPQTGGRVPQGVPRRPPATRP